MRIPNVTISDTFLNHPAYKMQGDSRGRVNIFGDNIVGHCEKKKFI